MGGILMYTIEDIRTGDVLLFKPIGFDPVGWLVAFFSDKYRYCHAAIAIDNSRLIEMGPGGFGEGPIPANGRIDVYRLFITNDKSTENYHARYLLAKSALGLKKHFKNYGFTAGIGQLINELFDNFVPELDNAAPLVYNKDELNCSQMVSRAFLDAFGYSLIDGVHSSNVKPSDIPKSKYLKKQFSLKGKP